MNDGKQGYGGTKWTKRQYECAATSERVVEEILLNKMCVLQHRTQNTFF